MLDRDSDRVKLLRSYGFKVYYGDATRIPILRAAGIEDAEILVLCLDDPDDNMFIAELVREHYPKVKIFVRAKNRIDAYEYLNNGINHIYRETLGTAVDMAIDVLHETGMRKYAARRLGQRFMAIDKASIRKLAKSKEEDDIELFTTKEILQREEELLAFDNLNFDTKIGRIPHQPKKKMRKIPRVNLLNAYASATAFVFTYVFQFAFFRNINAST